MPTIRVLAAVVMALMVASLLCERVSAHSEQFHRFPLPGMFEPLPGAAQPEPSLSNSTCILCDGTNAEAYWSFDGTMLSLQRIPPNASHACDIIYTMNADGSDLKQVAPLLGRDTCSYLSPDGASIYYSSTMSAGEWCPPTPDMANAYLWPIYPSMNVYNQNLATGNYTPLTKDQGYNAELTIAPNGKWAIFTSDRSGDLELYSFELSQPEAVRRLTYSPGYDGGAYYSFDSSMICWRANRPTGENLTDYLNLISLGLVDPTNMQLYVANADGSNARQVAQLPGTNFAPSFLPDDSGLIFSSNMDNPAVFQLYTINLDGTNLTQVTYDGSFNAFPMFSPDGQSLVWASNRDAPNYGDINIYVADWVGPGNRR